MHDCFITNIRWFWLISKWESLCRRILTKYSSDNFSKCLSTKLILSKAMFYRTEPQCKKKNVDSTSKIKVYLKVNTVMETVLCLLKLGFTGKLFSNLIMLIKWCKIQYINLGETKLIFWFTGKIAKENRVGRSVGKIKVILFDF